MRLEKYWSSPTTSVRSARGRRRSGATWTATNATGSRRTPANSPVRRCGGPGTPAPGPRAARTRSSPAPGPTSWRGGEPSWPVLGYRDPAHPVSLAPTPIGALDRDGCRRPVLTRLAAGRSAWNAADVRGEVERLIAAEGIVADAAVRLELAEDLTARALGRCVPLLDREGVPEHVRSWTSRPVLDVEADLRHPVRRPRRSATAGCTAAGAAAGRRCPGPGRRSGRGGRRPGRRPAAGGGGGRGRGGQDHHAGRRPSTCCSGRGGG